jgi:hypothetical protein
MSRLLQGVAAIAFAAVLAGPLSAADEKPVTKPAEVKAVFHDGTTIHKAVLQDAIEITTKYGKLTIPAADIRRIEFGQHSDGEAGKKVEDLIKSLGSDDFSQRDTASKDLVKLGGIALPALEQATKSTDKEVATRAKAALDTIRATVPADRLALKAEDVVTTADCVFTGKISGTIMKAHTENFGEMQFKMAQLAMIQSNAEPDKRPGMTGPGGPFPMGGGPGFGPPGGFPGGGPGVGPMGPGGGPVGPGRPMPVTPLPGGIPGGGTLPPGAIPPGTVPPSAPQEK